jgi:hypothetical protein
LFSVKTAIQNLADGCKRSGHAFHLLSVLMCGG